MILLETYLEAGNGFLIEFAPYISPLDNFNMNYLLLSNVKYDSHFKRNMIIYCVK